MAVKNCKTCKWFVPDPKPRDFVEETCMGISVRYPKDRLSGACRWNPEPYPITDGDLHWCGHHTPDIAVDPTLRPAGDPETMVSALQDRVHEEKGPGRIAKAVRVQATDTKKTELDMAIREHIQRNIDAGETALSLKELVAIQQLGNAQIRREMEAQIEAQKAEIEDLKKLTFRKDETHDND